jgi:hypothetical protein
MRSLNAVTLALVVLFMVVQVSACSASRSPQPTGAQVSEQAFLDILSGPLRDRFSDSVLIAEGKKVCEAKSKGQSWDQLEQMVAKDLNLDPDSGELTQFVGGVNGGLCEARPGG